MTDAEFDNYVKKRYEDQVAWYDKKAKRYKLLYVSSQICVLLFSGVAAIVAAFYPPWERVVLVILTTAATALGMIMVAFRFQDLWMNYRTVCETLRKEIHYYTARLGEYQSDADPRRVFVQRVEAVISREHTMMLLPLFFEWGIKKDLPAPPATGAK